MGKTASPLSVGFDPMQVTKTCMYWVSLNACNIRPQTTELDILERLSKCPKTHNRQNGISAFSRLFLI